MSNVGWSALLSDLYPEKTRAGIRGTVSSIGAVGSMIGVWAGGLAYDGLSHFYEGWGFDKGLLFFIASGIMAISTIPMFFVPEGGIGSEASSQPATNGVRPDLEEERSTSVSHRFVVFLIAMTFINFGMNSVALLKSQYLVLDEGFDVSSRLLGYIASMSSLGVFLFGLSTRRLTSRIRDETLLVIASIVSIFYLLGFVLARNLATVFLSNFLAGASHVIILATSYSYASRLIPPETRAKQFAMFNATRFLSWGIPATFITGPLVDRLIASGATHTFAYKMAFIAAALMVIVGTFILLQAIRITKK
jgi:MFS-type transporter involved in bile tolerance (Atg22 family)